MSYLNIFLNTSILFSCIRARGGWNNNPNCLQLKYTLRQMLLKNSITASRNANCQILDQHPLIPVLLTRKHESPLKDKPTTTVVNNECDAEVSSMMEHLGQTELTEFTMYVLHYISGYIVSTLLPRVSCPQCIDDLIASTSQHQGQGHEQFNRNIDDNVPSRFTNFVNRGGLYIPSTFTVKVVAYAEKVFKF